MVILEIQTECNKIFMLLYSIIILHMYNIYTHTVHICIQIHISLYNRIQIHTDRQMYNISPNFSKCTELVCLR